MSSLFLTLPLCLLSFDPHTSPPPSHPHPKKKGKRGVCPAMPTLLCCFSLQSVFSVVSLPSFHSSPSLSLALFLSPSLFHCVNPMSPADLGFESWHENSTCFPFSILSIHSHLFLTASPITHTHMPHYIPSGFRCLQHNKGVGFELDAPARRIPF